MAENSNILTARALGSGVVLGSLPPSTEVLPVLHDGLRQQSRGTPLRAIGIAENVTVTLKGERPTQAIKVLFEHKRGLTTALYLPFRKRFLRGYAFGKVFSVRAAPEVNAWADATRPSGT